MNTKNVIEIAIECGAVIDVLCMGRHDNVVFTSGEMQRFAQRIEQPHKQRIAELDLALQKQAKAALQGMDSAKRVSSKMLHDAKQIQSSLKPELLDSERQANAVLTEENEKLQQRIEQLREALGLLLDCAIHGYDMPEDHSYAIISRNALEQTK